MIKYPYYNQESGENFLGTLDLSYPLKIVVLKNYMEEQIMRIIPLNWWLTNEVYLFLLKWNKKVVVKKWENLLREMDFFSFVSKNWLSIFPKLLDVKEWGKVLVFEFREWINWKEIVDWITESNWETIWRQFWKSLSELHLIPSKLNVEEKTKWISEMIGYLKVEAKAFSQEDYDKELNLLRDLILSSDKDFVILHWDFSPHNCLFIKNGNNEFNISTILDPSGRIWYWINYFDIVYLFNTRWSKNKWKLKEWFLKEYNIDLADPLFIQFEKLIRMYLIEIYSSIWDTSSAENIKETLKNN